MNEEECRTGIRKVSDDPFYHEQQSIAFELRNRLVDRKSLSSVAAKQETLLVSVATNGRSND